jgi:hypothetical protein
MSETVTLPDNVIVPAAMGSHFDVGNHICGLTFTDLDGKVFLLPMPASMFRAVVEDALKHLDSIPGVADWMSVPGRGQTMDFSDE